MASVVPSDSFQNSQRSSEELLQNAIVNNEFVKGRHRNQTSQSEAHTAKRGTEEERLIITDDPQMRWKAVEEEADVTSASHYI